ncbi:MAG TPA: class I SAM-dependent methyltransferase [Methanocorpusculum sp.]|nr:class I SAM-dependent methyltransferase [Methanocorpusculum sp.]
MQNEFQSDYCLRGRRWGGAAEVPSLPAGAAVLETGCGNGKSLHAFLSAGVRAFGVDISYEAVRLAGSAHAVAADIRHLPFKDGVFDAVFCRHVLGHLFESDRGAAAAELLRVVKPGGSLYFMGFGTDDFRFGSGTESECHSFLRGDGIMTHYFTADEVSGYFCGCSSADVFEKRWTLRVRGVEYPRCEVCGVFVK